MAEETACKNDHDALVTLVANVGNLKEGQDKFYLEMKDAFKDLKDNFAAKLESHETRLNHLEDAKTKQVTMMSIGAFLLSVLLGLVIYHINKMGQ